MSLVAHGERDQLERIDEAIEAWIAALRSYAEQFAGDVDSEPVQRILEESKNSALVLNERLPASLDPAAVAEIRGIMIEALPEVESMTRPLDVIDSLVVRAEAIRHVIRDALDESLGCSPSDAKALANRLAEWLPTATRKQLATLVGAEERTFYRWLDEGGRATHRLFLVVRLVLLLKGTWSPAGVIAWFSRPRPELGNRPPIDLLDDPANELDLLKTARHGRAYHGA
jgi:uncharacterized protein (DUF2384 family)